MTDPTVPSPEAAAEMCCVCSRDYEGRTEPVHERPATHELALHGRLWHYCCRCFSHATYARDATVMDGRECTWSDRKDAPVLPPHPVPSCTRRHRCPDTETRVVEAAIAWRRIRHDPLSTSHEVADAALNLEAAVRVMEGDDDAH